MDLKNSKTAVNLMTAFAGESQARNRYTYFAAAAQKEGFRQISEIFEETANQEKEHAKRLFKFMDGGVSGILPDAAFPFGPIAKTRENLLEGAGGEHYEWETMYPSFATIADEEGFADIATVFRNIAIAEKQHEKRYLALASNIEKSLVFTRPQPVIWRCINCGWLHEGTSAPKVCAACNHPTAHFEILAENW